MQRVFGMDWRPALPVFRVLSLSDHKTLKTPELKTLRTEQVSSLLNREQDSDAQR
jgi:hypothetical protein